MPETIYILCGGTSRRMGEDKALLPVEQFSMLERLSRRCSRYFSNCKLLSGNQQYNLPFEHIPDYLSDAGPLSAFAGALQHHQGSCFAIIPVDMPLLEEATLHFLSRVNLPNHLDALIGTNSQRIHPLVGIYSTGVQQSLISYLDKGSRSVRGFLEQIRIRTFDLTPKESLNANTPDEYQKAISQIK